MTEFLEFIHQVKIKKVSIYSLQTEKDSTWDTRILVK